MTRVLVLTRYARRGPSSRLRFLQFADGLARAGLALTVRPLLSDRYLRILYAEGRRPTADIAAGLLARLGHTLDAGGYDCIWLEGESLPWLPWPLERLLLSRARRLVIDYDDALFDRYERSGSAVLRWLNGGKIDRLMARADAVVVGNEYLAARARRAGARAVTVLPTVVDLARYPFVAADAGNPRPVIGWIGTPQTSHYLEPIAPLLHRMAEEGRASIELVGARREPWMSPHAVILPWQEETEAAAVSHFDIGVMPLSDDLWSQGKSGFKIVQCMAAGRPVIASPVGVNRQLVRHGETGLLAGSPAEWSQALETLLGDAGLRARMGAAARRIVERELNVEAVLPVLARLLRGA